MKPSRTYKRHGDKAELDAQYKPKMNRFPKKDTRATAIKAGAMKRNQAPAATF